MKPNIIIQALVRTTALRKMFSKRDSIVWSHILYKVTEIFNDTIPRYRIDNLPDRYNEALLKKTELTVKEDKDGMKA